MSSASFLGRWPLLRHPLIVSAAIIALAAILRAFAGASEAFFIGFMAILLATVMSFPVGWLSRIMPRGPAVLCTLLLLVGLAAGVFLVAMPTLSQEASNLSDEVPQAINRLHRWASRIRQQPPMPEIAGAGQVTQNVQNSISTATGNIISKTIPAAFSFISGLSFAILTLVLAAFFVHQPGSYLSGFGLFVPQGYEPVLSEAWSRLGNGLRHWVKGTLISMALMGTFAGVGLFIAGIKGWFLLGIVTFLGTSVPYIGAIASAIPGLLVGLAQSPTHFFYAVIVYLGVHLVEGYVVEPFVMKKAVLLNPGTLLFWQLLMGSIFGIGGIAIATPLFVCIRILTQYLYTEIRLGKAAG